MLRGTNYSVDGQVTHEYACEIAGDLTGFDVAVPGVPVFSQMSFTYHPISGRIETESVALNDGPFGLDAPQGSAVTTHNYDTTGTWEISVDSPDPTDPTGTEVVTTLLEYDDQGRIKKTTSPGGVVSHSDVNGRGLTTEQYVGADDGAGGVTDFLQTSTTYNDDGQVDTVTKPAGRR